jgi:hypothetical protein
MPESGMLLQLSDIADAGSSLVDMLQFCYFTDEYLVDVASLRY